VLGGIRKVVAMKPDDILIPCPLPERKIHKDEMAISYCAGRCMYYNTCNPVQQAQKSLPRKK
jgi:hypothetical protein